MTAKRPWTPGEWKAMLHDEDDFDDGTYVIMDTRIKSPGNYRCAHEWKSESVKEPEALANARLFAAAPQLYDVMEALLYDPYSMIRDSIRKKAEEVMLAANPAAFGEVE